MPQMAEKTEPDAPPNCAVLPKKKPERGDPPLKDTTFDWDCPVAETAYAL